MTPIRTAPLGFLLGGGTEGGQSRKGISMAGAKSDFLGACIHKADKSKFDRSKASDDAKLIADALIAIAEQVRDFKIQVLHLLSAPKPGSK